MKLKYIKTVLIFKRLIIFSIFILPFFISLTSAAIINPSFEYSSGGWSTFALLTNSQAHTGVYSYGGYISGTSGISMNKQTIVLTNSTSDDLITCYVKKTAGIGTAIPTLVLYNTNDQAIAAVGSGQNTTNSTWYPITGNLSGYVGTYKISLSVYLYSGGSGNIYWDDVYIGGTQTPSLPSSSGKIYFTNDPYDAEDVANINIITNYSYNNLGWKWESILDSPYEPSELGRNFIDSLLGDACVFYKTCIVVDTDAGNYTTHFSKTQDIGLELIQETSNSITMFNYPISNSTDNVIRTRYLETTWVYTGYSARLKALSESGYFNLFGYGRIGDFLAGSIDLTPVLNYTKTIDTDYAYHENDNNVEIIELKDNLYDYINTSVTNMSELINNTVNESYFNNTPLENITKILENVSNNNFYNITNVTYLTNESVQHLTVTNTSTNVSQFFNNTSVTQQFFNNTTQVIQYLNNTTYITVTNGSGYNYTPDTVMNSSFMQGYKETIDNSLGNLMKLLYDFVSIIIYPLSKMSEALTSLSDYLYEMLPSFALWNVLIPPIFDYLPQSVINTLGLGLILAIILEILER